MPGVKQPLAKQETVMSNYDPERKLEEIVKNLDISVRLIFEVAGMGIGPIVPPKPKFPELLTRIIGAADLTKVCAERIAIDQIKG
jgi:hypothetical protein